MEHKDLPPPLWAVIVASAVMGVIAQLGASLALEMAKDRTKLYGFLLLSLVISGATPILLIRLAHMDAYVASALGALVGAIPALWTLRAGVKLIGQKYGLEVGEITTAGPTSPPKGRDDG